ncbi:sensor histidine kinase [Paenibacillus gorillae]|uniref:sensor histidine kinase n=1 Tax=Paenibacillus gorillae TaxID=1243662 RepID=UPI0004B0795C|nr:sensor histidine kinase [Paenibacillus gorillae]
MRKRLLELPWNSLRFKLVLGLLGVTVPLIVLLLVNSQYSINVVHKQVALSNQNLISVYMNLLDGQLAEAERHIAGLAFAETSVQQMNAPRTEDEYMLAKSGVSRRLSADLSLYPAMDGFYVYSLVKDDVVDAYRPSMSFESLSQLRGIFMSAIRDLEERPSQRTSGWRTIQDGDDAYLFRLIKDGNLYIGAWSKASKLLGPLDSVQTGPSGAVLLVNGEGEKLAATRKLDAKGLNFKNDFSRYYLSGEKKDFLVVGEKSGRGEMALVAVMSDKTLLQSLPYLNKAASLVVLIALFMLPLSYWLLRKVLLLPLWRIVSAMRRTGDGNFNFRMETGSAADEFRLVNETFNRMVSQIEELKIHVYEEQLSKQRVELKQLQLQINPHFFMNTLNILYTLAQHKRFELIQELTMHLVHYFRYLFQSNHPLVLLKDELAHVRNYLNIQRLRFPHYLNVNIQVPDYLGNTPIPPLMLQTVVENSIKHALKTDKPITLSIEADVDDLAEVPMVCLVISDNGEGYSEEALEAVRSGKRLVDDNGEHIGLWNVRERLRLQYGDLAWLECYNDDPQGAVTEITVPLNPVPEEKEMSSHAPLADNRR